jgi:hypothetical protein
MQEWVGIVANRWPSRHETRRLKREVDGRHEQYVQPHDAVKNRIGVGTQPLSLFGVGLFAVASLLGVQETGVPSSNVPLFLTRKLMRTLLLLFVLAPSLCAPRRMSRHERERATKASAEV